MVQDRRLTTVPPTRSVIGAVKPWTPTWQVMVGQVGYTDHFTLCLSRLSHRLIVDERQAHDRRYGIPYLKSRRASTGNVCGAIPSGVQFSARSLDETAGQRGGRGIRTHGDIAATAVFKTAAIGL